MTKLVLSEGHVTPDSPISVQLIKNHHPEARPIVVITWPSHVTEVLTGEAGRGDQQRNPHSRQRQHRASPPPLGLAARLACRPWQAANAPRPQPMALYRYDHELGTHFVR